MVHARMKLKVQVQGYRASSGCFGFFLGQSFIAFYVVNLIQHVKGFRWTVLMKVIKFVINFKFCN